MKTSSQSNSLGDSLKSGFAAVVIPVEILIAIFIYIYVLGDGANFEGGDSHNHPLPGNFFGIVYKGGFLVPILISLLMMVVTFGIERLLTISSAKGRGSIKNFVSKIRSLLNTNSIDQAIAECDRQKGSVANV